jgi:hypothetical protein
LRVSGAFCGACAVTRESDYRRAGAEPLHTYRENAMSGHFVSFSGSTVLMEPLETYKEKIPFSATIKKVGKYFTFS